MYHLVVTFSITYLKVQVHADTSDILWWLLVAHFVHFIVIPQVGRLSDRFGRRPVYLVGAIGAGAWGFFAFPMMSSGRYQLIMAAIIIGLVIHALMYAPQPGDDGRDVSDPDALLRCVIGLSGDRDLRRVTGPDHRG